MQITQTKTTKLEEAKRALKASLTVATGFLLFGMTFGFYCEQSGYPWFLAPVMSILINAGTSQMVTTSMLSINESMFEIVFMVLIVNLRHIFYGLSLLDIYPKTMLTRFGALYGTTDETYSILTSTKDANPTFWFFLSLINSFYWIFGSLAGALLGYIIKIEIPGLEFITISLFVVLSVEQFIKIRKFRPFITAIASGFIANVFFPGQMLVVGIVLCTAAFWVFFRLERKN